jgi:hypothetical protein
VSNITQPFFDTNNATRLAAFAITEYKFEEITTNLIDASSIACRNTPAFCRADGLENRAKQNNEAQ